MKKRRISDMLLLHLLLCLYSFTGVFAKLAASQSLFHIKFFVFYITEFVLLFFYAVGWQQILKKIPLTTAFMHKSITIVWGMFWGILFFKETVTAKNIVGVILVMSGMIVYLQSGEK